MKRTPDFALIEVMGELTFLYGLLGWVYGVLIQATHPSWLPGPVSHLTLWLRLDTFTIVSFFCSAAGFFVWRLSRVLVTSREDLATQG